MTREMIFSDLDVTIEVTDGIEPCENDPDFANPPIGHRAKVLDMDLDDESDRSYGSVLIEWQDEELWLYPSEFKILPRLELGPIDWQHHDGPVFEPGRTMFPGSPDVIEVEPINLESESPE